VSFTLTLPEKVSETAVWPLSLTISDMLLTPEALLLPASDTFIDGYICAVFVRNLYSPVRLPWALELGSGNYRYSWMQIHRSCIPAASATVFLLAPCRLGHCFGCRYCGR
jgi:hypothetical protein